MKKNLLISVASVILCAVLLSGILVSCSQPAGPEETTPSVLDTTVPEEDITTLPSNVDENGYLLDDLPELDYGKKEFTIFTWSNQTMWEWAETDTTTGDIIKDALFTRQAKTEDRLKVKIEIVKQPGEWENRNSFIDAVYNNTSAGINDDSFDLIGQYTPAMGIGAVRGCYTDLSEIKYLDLEKPWWPDDIYTSSAIGGHVYGVAGDISCTLIRNMSCILTNLTLADSLHLPDFYALVKDHAWTAEKFLEFGTGTVTGLNPDGSSCLTTTFPSNVSYDNVFYSGGFRFVESTPEGGLQLSEDLSSTRMADWFDLWHGFWAQPDTGVLGLTATNGFTSGNVLFHFGSIADVQNSLQEIEFKFGILPYPLYDKDQNDYCSICGYWVTMYSVPVTAPDKDMTGAVLECLGSEGYREITPAVYNVSFQYRYLNSIENAEIFDLLHDTLIFEPGRTFGDQINCFAGFRQAAGQSDSWTSYYKGQSAVWKKNINKVVDALS
ncbi:MAG: extracellular solute-binding protein [Clostridia bacterium]|nr:extracellular solute-binding protein [Clostridia bacterium]